MSDTGSVKLTPTLTITCLLSILFMTFHVTDDIVHGFEPGGLFELVALVALLVVFLYGTLVLAERRSGYVIIFFGSLLGAVMPVLHMKGNGVGEIARTSGGFFFVFILLALGVTSVFSLVLSVRGLWGLRRGQRPEPK
jgi:hypothetical protein